jgi:hypothetical protein
MRRNEELYAPFSNQKLFIDILMNEFLCYSKKSCPTTNHCPPPLLIGSFKIGSTFFLTPYSV